MNNRRFVSIVEAVHSPVGKADDLLKFVGDHEADNGRAALLYIAPGLPSRDNEGGIVALEGVAWHEAGHAVCRSQPAEAKQKEVRFYGSSAKPLDNMCIREMDLGEIKLCWMESVGNCRLFGIDGISHEQSHAVSETDPFVSRR